MSIRTLETSLRKQASCIEDLNKQKARDADAINTLEARVNTQNREIEEYSKASYLFKELNNEFSIMQKELE